MVSIKERVFEVLESYPDIDLSQLQELFEDEVNKDTIRIYFENFHKEREKEIFYKDEDDLNNEKDENPYSKMSFTELNKIFYEKNDILELVGFLEDVIIQRKICSDFRCPLFPPLEKIHIWIRETEATNPDDALKICESKDSPLYKDWFFEYRDMLIYLETVYNEVIKISITSNTQRFKMKENQKTTMELLKEINKGQHGTPFEFSNPIQESVNNLVKDSFFDNSDNSENRNEKEEKDKEEQ